MCSVDTTVRPVVPMMDPRSLVCFCPGCAAMYPVTGLSVGGIRCPTCEDHGGQLVVEVRRYEDVKALEKICDEVAMEARRSTCKDGRVKARKTNMPANTHVSGMAKSIPIITHKGDPCPVDGNTTCQEGTCSSCVKPESANPSTRGYDNTTRAEKHRWNVERVLKIIQENPGITRKRLAAKTKLSALTLDDYFLQESVLRENVEVRNRGCLGKVYYYPKGMC